MKMQIVDFSKPGEKKKLIWAAVLGLIAILFLWWTFVGFGKSSGRSAKPVAASAAQTARPSTDRPTENVSTLSDYREVVYTRATYNVPEATRNIFAYYEPPPVTPAASVSTPTPTPTPPLLLAAVSPSNVYARTADFTLEVSGDRYTPDLRIFVDGRELVTTYKGPQQLSTVVPASVIANPGVRQVVVRTSDNRLYSNPGTLSVAAPPTPNYSYIGIIGPKNFVDTALLQDRSNKEILNVHRGDILSGRFRVTSISEKELVMVDTNLKIKHSLTMTEGEKGAGSPLSRPTPKVDAEDDEP